MFRGIPKDKMGPRVQCLELLKDKMGTWSPVFRIT